MEYEEHALDDGANYGASGEAYFLVNQDHLVVGFNAADPAWGLPLKEQNRSQSGIETLANDDRISVAIGRILAGEAAIDLRISFSSEDGAQRSANVRLRRLSMADGSLALVMVQRVVERPIAAAMHDPLTGLPDRRALVGRIDEWRLEGSTTSGFGVLFLDLDGFKGINDRHGHATGDHVLSIVAKRWARSIRDGDLLVRYGGDEFVALVKNAASPVAVDPVVRRLQEATSEAIDLGEIQLHVAVTIGVAFSDGVAGGVEDLIAAADRDMYSRKRSGAPIMPR